MTPKAVLTFSVAALTCGVASADTPPTPATYALVVGSNAGGPGQQTLRYAEHDARRMGQILAELGGYHRDRVDVVVGPTPDRLREALARLSSRVAADRAAGRDARVFFYYSGHARATAIDLGPAAMPLTELRQRLFASNAALTVVVLDACQSGAFSRVKGATPAADFSFNSRSQLDAKGIAVLASSSDSELSQESEQLKGSYFTHHLMVGMRGAGDANKDGTVSVDEAYRYAYHQTLLATAATAVGGQHVSLEVDLKGHGEVPLSFPRAATATIELPASLEGHALISDRRARAVVAETHKVKGGAVRIAVAPGDYDVLVRQGNLLRRCAVTASGAATVELARCSTEAVTVATRKGDGGLAAVTIERPLRIEIGAVIGGEHADAFTQTLTDFGYEKEFLGASSGLSIGVARRLALPIAQHVWIGGSLGHVQSPTWRRGTDLSPLTFSWTTTSLLGFLRGHQPVGESRLALYGQLGAGLAMGRTDFEDAMDVKTRETYFGPAVAVSAGLSFGNLFTDGLAASLGYELSYAPVIDNNFDETHASGGHRLSLGLAYSY